MKRILLSIALALGTPAIAAPCRLALNSQLTLQGAEPLITAHINNQPVTLMLDTGAEVTILTQQAAKRLALHADTDTSSTFRGEPPAPWTLSGISGRTLAEEILVKDFAIGAMHGKNIHFLVADVPDFAADGLLSTDFLEDYDIDLDYAGGEIRLFVPTGSCDHASVLLQSPLFQTPLLPANGDPRPRVIVTLDDHDLTALIDTGADRTTLYRQAAETLGHATPATGDEKITMQGVTPGSAASFIHKFNALSIGDVTWKGVKLPVLETNSHDGVDLLIGRDLQRKIHMWIANHARTLVMQYPPQPSPPISRRADFLYAPR